ncbi:MAG: cytochrome b5 domain-containing protein, partial [Pseudomonadales bacterium]
EVAQHAAPDSNWIIVDDKVYDVTKFAMFHPGGRAFIDKVAGSDATKQFYAFHRQDVLRSHGSKYLIGTLADAPSKRDATVALAPGELSAVPYAESGAFQGLPSPYYDDSHRRFRRDLRHFFDEKVVPDAVANDWRLSPLLAADHTGVAPAFIATCELDPIRDEGNLYAEKLAAAGVEVQHKEWAGQPHVLFQLSPVLDDGKALLAECVEALQKAFS